MLNTPYTDWLLVGCRKMQKLDNHPLVTSYMEESLGCEKKYLMELLQFLSFIKGLEGVEERLGNQIYYLIEFPLIEFMVFLKAKTKYQRSKTLDFLKSLQKLDPLTTNFSDILFRSSIAFPYLEIEKQGKFWVVQVSVAKELYFYNYPFIFPKYFLLFKGKYESEVKFEFLLTLSRNRLKKIFYVGYFLNTFAVSKKNRLKICQLILSGFSVLIDEKIIGLEAELVYTDESYEFINLKKLTSSLIGNRKIKEICFYEVIKF